MRIVRDQRLTSGFLQERPLADLPALTHCGEGVTTRLHALDVHRHEAFELMYVCRGSYTWWSGGRAHLQRATDVFVTRPGESHRTAEAPHPVCHQLWLGVDLALLPGSEGADLAQRLQESGRHVVRGCAEVEPLMRGVLLQTVSTAPDRAEVVTAYLRALVSVLRQRLAAGERADGQGSRAGQSADGTAMPHTFPVLKALELMREHLAERLTLEDLALAAGLGESQLCRRFRDELGMSPARHHRQMRLDEARRRLRNPETSVVDTAVSCGFSSSQHLSTLFKEAYGVSPRRWQQQSGRADRSDD